MKNNSNKRCSITTSFWHKLLVNLLVLCFLVQPNLAIIVSEKSSGNLPSRSEKSSPKQEVNESESPKSSLVAAAEIAEASKHSFSLKSFLSLFEATNEDTEPTLAPLPLPTPTPEPFAIVRKGFNLNGKIDGSIQQLNGETTIFNSTGNMTGDLKVPGVPSVVVNGAPIWSGVVTGTGTATPTAYQIILNSGAKLRNLLNRTNPVAMPSVPTPTASTGTVSLVISNPSQVPSSFANIRDVTLNTGAGIVAVPPGNYRNFIVNSGSKLKFGTVGSSQPVVYNIAQLTLNSTSALEIVGPVIINSSSNITINGSTGVLANEGMLRLRMSAGNFTLNSSSNFYGSVTAPNGTITINSNSNLYGNIACNILTINSGGLLKISPLDVLPAVSLAINSPANNSSTTATSITVSGTASSQSGIANVLVNNQPATYNVATQTWTISNVPLVIGSNTIPVIATDNTGAQTTSTITVTRTQPPPPDTTAPSLSILSPVNGSTTQATSTSVSGTVADLGTNASGVASVTVNGSNAAISGGNWNFANVGLNIGSNTITVRATDVAGNFTTQTVTSVRQPANVPDTTPPTISVTAPLNNSTTQAETTTVSGTVTDTGGTTPSGVANVKVNGVNALLTGGNWSLANVALTIGSNIITVTSTDNAGNTSTQSIIVNRENVPDTTPPTLAITSPANNSTTQAETTTVTGTVSDTGGTIPSGVANVKVNGVNAAITGGTWSFTNFALNIGTTTINVQATDVAGNVSNAQVTITREPVPDTTPPTITIANPANNSTTQAETISVNGTATDTGGTTPSGIASITVNGVSATFDSATGNWNFASVALNIGTNTITVIATDTAGNISTSAVTVTREAIPDTTPPTLIVTSPANNSTTQAETITVSGTVTDTGGTTPSGVANVKVNGVTATLTGENWTLANVALVVGANTITVTSADNTGNLATQTVTVTRELPPDTNPPVITINSPQNQSSTYEGQITVTGTAVDLGINASGVQHVFVNGIEAALQANGNWSASVSLNIGNNPITVTATDAATPTNQGTAQIQVTRLENPSPTLTITSPSNNLTTTSETISVSGTAAANGSTTNLIAQITVNGQNAIFDVNTNTWTLSNVAIAIGINTITAQATDSSGKQTTSQITITRNPINQPPTVNAGIDQSINLPNYANLNGLVNDDGLPNNPPTSIWSKISGGGTVIFSNVNNLQTNASFSTSGIYILRLTSFDGEFSASDDIAITVNPGVQAPIPNNYRQFSDSPWYNFSGSWFYLEDFEDHILNTPGVSAPFGGLVSILYGPTFHDSVDGDDGILDGSGSNGDTFYNPNAFQGIKFVFNQQVLGNYPTHAGLVYTDGYNEGETYYEAFGSNGNSLGIRGPFAFPSTTHKGESINDFFLGFYNQGGISAIRIWNTQADIEIDHLQYGYREPSGNNVAPSVNIGADQTINLPNSANLLAAVTDDGLPVPANLTSIWSKVSGAGNVTFSDLSSPQTTAQFSNVGEYILRLSVFDGEFTSTDDVTILVNQVNLTPVVNAGFDQVTNLTDAAILSGTATDDGRPIGASLTYTWSKISGPGIVSFSNQGSLGTSANFSTGGIYVLRLTASDSNLTGFDEMIVTVNPFVPSCPTNDFEDNFNANLLNLNNWEIVEPSSPTVASVQNQKLEFILQPNTFGTNRIISKSSYDFRGRSFEVEVPQVSSQAGYTQTFIRVVLDSNNYFLLGTSAGTTFFYTYTNGSANSNAIGTFSSADKFWRIKHNIDNNSVLYETSIDGISWKTEKSVPQTFSLNNLKLEVGAGAYGTGNSTPGKAVFDNLKLAPSFPYCSLNVSVISPINNSSLIAGTNNLIEAAVSDRDGQVSKVEFYIDGIKIGETLNAPYQINWNNVNAGIYHISAKAIDNRGYYAVSSPITVTVNNPNTNRPPVVNAGVDQTIKLPASATLTGTMSDDALPSGGNLTSTWTKVSGPGNVTFSDNTSLTTTATFSLAGYYVLRLTASDSALTATDDVVLRIGSESALLPGGIFISGHDSDDHAVHSEGARNVIRRAISFVTYGKNSPRILLVTDLRNPGGDQEDPRVGLQLSGFTTFDVADYGSNTPNTLSINTVDFNNYDLVFVASDFGGWLRQEELDGLNSRSNDLINYVNQGGSIVAFAESGSRAVPPGDYAGTTHLRFKFIPLAVDSARFNQTESSITVTPFGLSMGLTNADVSANASHNIFLTNGGMDVVDVDQTNQIISLASRGNFLTNEGLGNNAPLVDAGLSQVITLPTNSASLNATVTDDELPSGRILTQTWSKINGPGNVSFSQPNNLSTNAIFSEPGNYTLRLTATDGQRFGASNVSIVVSESSDIVCNGGDNFNDNERNVIKWLRPTDGASVSEINEHLEIKPVANFPTARYFGYISSALCDVSSKNISVEVVQTTTVNSGAETYFILRGTNGDYLTFAESGGSLYMQSSINGSFDQAIIAHDATNHHFWRYKFQPNTNSIGWETSADGQNWTLQRTFDITDPLPSFRVELIAGTYYSSGNPGTAIFDNFLIESSVNSGPAVNITNPANGSIFSSSAIIPISANTTDTDGSVTKVDFYAGTALIASDSTAPYSFNWSNVPVGSCNIRAIAFDNTGDSTISAPISITVTAIAPVNQPPTVAAGNDQTITLPSSAILSGTATDDGLPAGSPLLTIWTKTSGSGSVAFSNANSASTSATFDAPGVYILRLTVDDGQFFAFDETVITVNADTPTNLPPTANAGNDQAAMFKANLTKNPSAEADLVNGSLPNWTSAQGAAWTRVLGEQANVPAARFGDYVFKANDAANAEIRQTIDISGFAGVIDAGTRQFAWQAYIHSSAETNPDTGKVIVEYLNSTQNVIATLTSDDIISTDNWHLTEDTRVPPVGTRFMRLRLIAIRNNGTTNDVFFDGLSLKAVGDVAAVRLSGTATDDGLPVGNPFTKIWTKVSGNGTVLFAANEAISGSTYDAPSTYTLRLTASDGVLSATDDVTVTINPANQAPTTNAGIDQTITLPATAQLNGTASDDVGNLRYRWTKVYGSGGGTGLGVVTFSNARLLNPTASFTLPGTYVLRLTTEDGELETTDDVTVTVNPGATNLPPTVSPGSNQTIVLPINSVQLSGTVTDDGLPTNNLTINWTKTSGSGNVIFSNPTSPQTTATFSAAGVYVLRLTAADGQYTVWHEVLVAVIPVGGQGGTNLAPTVNAGSDQIITVSQTGILEAQVSDDGLPAGGNFSANWTKVSGAGNVTFSNPNDTATYANFSQTGVYVVRLTVSDSLLTAFDDVTVTVSDNQPAPTVDILTPLDGANLTDKTDITGNVSGGNWKVEYALKTGDNSNNLSWTLLNQGSGAVSNSSLAAFDTTLLLNGLYAIRLTTSDQFGQNAIDEISLVVERNLKVGQFTVSFEDMSVPVAGIPIQVIRTYDSRDKRKGDFGYGWTLGIKNLRVEKSQVLGLKWRGTTNGGLFPTYCIENTKPHIVSVTMPDGKVEKFDARLQKMCQQYVPLQGGNLIFAAQPGTTGKLEVVGDNTIQVAGSIPGPVDFIGFNGQGIFDSAQFKYTSKDGTEFILNQNGGLQSVKDLNNNTLTISANGITHSSGKSVSFTRDNQGRISAITDPDGKIQTYNYDANGDLISFINRASETTSYSYYTNPAHHLKDITDARGITPIRNEYDVAGRLIKHIDANGNEIIYTHDLAAKTEIVRDRLGNATTFAYDVRGNVLQKTDALGNVSLFSYDLSDNVLTETNALGRTTTYTYDGNDNRTSVTDALGNRSEFTYNNLSSLVTAKDAKNNVTTNVYGFRNSLSSTTDALGNVTSNVYLAATGQRATTTDALGNTTAFAYFGNFLTKQTDAQGNETTFDYSPNGNPTSQTVKRTNALGQLETITTISEFDNLNRLTKTTYADGTFTRTEYNTIGQQAATVDQAGNRTEFEYDSLGRQIKTTYADGKFEETTFDAEGRRLTSKDRSGKVTNYEYDVLGRLKKTTYSDGTFTSTNYDAIGRVISNTDAKGNTTTQEYDPNCGCPKRKSKITNALGQITTFAYDNNGNQISMTDARGNTTNYEFDALNQQTKITYPDNTFSQVIFDALGRKISSKDQAGKITNYTYDSLGNLTKVTDALNQETKFSYNELSQQVTQVDAKNNTTRYEYDKLGRRTKRMLPLGQVETYDYNNLSNLTSKTDFNGKTTTFNYDSMRRLLNKIPDASLNEPNISFTYNDLGQRHTMTDANGMTIYVYDSRNRLASKQTPQGNLNYTYDENGSLKTLRSNHVNGVSADYTYDNLNRLQAVKDNRLTNGLDTTSYAYDGVGNLSVVSMPNGVSTSYNYNSSNRLTNLNTTKIGNIIASYAYTLGATGNRTQVVENTGRTVNYAYDDLYRLTSETIANSSNNGQINYQYDAVGNRIQRNSSVNLVANQNSSFDANDRLNSDVFDANGNTKISSGNSYGHDFENRLTSTGNIQIIYDGDGNRISKTVNGLTTKFLVDTNNLTGYAQVVEELQNGSVTKQYTYGNDLISQRQVTNGNTVNFYGYDGHRSVRNLTDVSGSLTDTYSYDAFGNLLERNGTTGNNYLYAGEQFDSDLGLYYNRARYLNVSTGRFLSQDNYEGSQFEPKSLHKYLYASNNPTNRVDPSGYFSIAEQSIAININGILSTMSNIRAVAAVVAVTCAIEAGAAVVLDIDPLTPCGVKGPQKILYRGTTFYDYLETVATQHIDWIRIMTNQSNFGFDRDRFGVYFTSQITTAEYYAGLVGAQGRAGGPGIVRVSVPENRFRRFTVFHGIAVDVPIPQSPLPGQTETVIPFAALPEFEMFATYF
jgi:RHS repeat-associated protein